MTDLDELMAKVDAIDAELVSLLGNRFTLSREIGRFKLRDGKPKFDSSRITQQKSRFVDLCERASLAPGMARILIDGIIDQVLRERVQLYAQAESSSDGITSR